MFKMFMLQTLFEFTIKLSSDCFKICAHYEKIIFKFVSLSIVLARPEPPTVNKGNNSYRKNIKRIILESNRKC